MEWRTRPVFVSSTFQDMQAERDHLRTYVFPELEERLRAVRVHLEWVDLRLGIATASLPSESAREQQVLKVCLAEARRCRPFTIVLLGDRYGWIPPPERVASAAVEAGLDADVTGSSVTELEIRVGILAAAASPHRCFVYLRDPMPFSQMPADVAASYADALDPEPAARDRAARLETMKRRLERELPDRVRHYTVGWDCERSRVTGLESWGRVVLEDLWRELSGDIVTIGPELSPSELERNAVEDFAIDRARDFVGRERVLNWLERVATSSEAGDGACVTGAPGAGKSALMGELTRRLRASDAFVLTHATDASPRSSSVDLMLRRFVEDLAAAVGAVRPPETATVETLDTTFASLVAKLAKRQRVIILVDGLDQFEQTPRGRFLTWLPRAWPANARFIASASPGDASQSLSERAGINMVALPPLDAGEARHVAKAICSRYHRAIEPDVLHALVEKTSPAGLACGHPLWLTIAVEELNLLDADDFERVGRSYSGTPAERLRSLMLDLVSELPPDADALYGVVFDRAETLFGSRFARGFLKLLALSRGGWREPDFRALLPRFTGEPWDGLRFASLRRVFRGQLRQHGEHGQWDVTHAQMRVGARARVIGRADVAGAHAQIADYLLSLEADDPLRVTEAPRHLLAAGDWRRAASYYGDGSLTDASIESATRALLDHLLASSSDRADAAQIIGLLLGNAGVDDGLRERVAKLLLYYFTDASEGHVPLAARITVIERLEEAIRASLMATPGRAASLVDLSVAQNKRGRLLKEAGRGDEALSVYREASATFKALAEQQRDNRLWPRGLAMTLRNIGDLLFASGELDQAMSPYWASVGIAQRLADGDPSDRDAELTLATSLERIGRTLMSRGRRAEALEAYRTSAAILEHLLGIDPQNIDARRSFVGSLLGVGEALDASGRRPEALSAYRSALTVAEGISAIDPEEVDGRRTIAVSQERIGKMLFDAGDAMGARAAWEQSLAIREKLSDSDPSNMEWRRDVANTLERLGATCHFVGNVREALEYYARGMAILDDLVSRDPGNREWRRALALMLGNKADSLAAAEQRDEALAAYEKSLGICRALLRDDPRDVRLLRQLSACTIAMGDVLDDMGHADSALTRYQESFAIRERLAIEDPGNAAAQNDLAVVHNRLGNLLAAGGKAEEALAAYRRSLEILSALAEADAQNPMYRFNMAVGYERVARILAKNHVEEARDAYRTRVAIAEQLVEADRRQWQGLLLSSYEKLRDFLAGNAARGHQWRHELMYRHAQIGALHANAGRLEQALPAHLEQLAVARELAEAEPGNLDRQRDVSVAYSAIGDVYTAAGHAEKALEAFQHDLAISEQLAAAHPADAQDQWALSTSQIRVGDALLANNHAGDALRALRNGLAIRERIALDHEENLGWQRGLAVSYNKLGNVLLAADRCDEALECFRRLVDVAARLAALHPDDEQWRRGLAESYAQVAGVLSRLGRQDEAREASRKGKAVSDDGARA